MLVVRTNERTPLSRNAVSLLALCCLSFRPRPGNPWKLTATHILIRVDSTTEWLLGLTARPLDSSWGEQGEPLTDYWQESEPPCLTFTLIKKRVKMKRDTTVSSGSRGFLWKTPQMLAKQHFLIKAGNKNEAIGPLPSRLLDFEMTRLRSGGWLRLYRLLDYFLKPLLLACFYVTIYYI